MAATAHARGWHPLSRRLPSPPQAINDTSSNLLALQDNVERNPQAIARLKTIFSLVAAGIAFLAATLKNRLFGSR